MSATAPFTPKAFKVLYFDVYGTLVDWETPIYEHLSALSSKSKTSPTRSRDEIIQAYSKAERHLETTEPTLLYSTLLTRVYQTLAKEWDSPFTPDDAEAFGASIGQWPAFPDSVDALKRLAKHYELVVLSNVDRKSFSATASDALAGVPFRAIYTAQDIGAYKPAQKNFEYLISKVREDIGVEKDQIWTIAHGVFHDHVATKKMGLKPGVWISRESEPEVAEKFKGEYEFGGVFETLGLFADAVDKDFEE